MTYRERIEAIFEEAHDIFGVNRDAIESKSREHYLVLARAFVVKRFRDELAFSFPHIGRLIGGRDHTTAIHLYRKSLPSEVEMAIHRSSTSHPQEKTS